MICFDAAVHGSCSRLASGDWNRMLPGYFPNPYGYAVFILWKELGAPYGTSSGASGRGVSFERSSTSLSTDDTTLNVV
jgi:hypothetical protein